MDALIGVAGFVVVAAITPGPNNLVVMRAAASSGFAGAMPAIVGIVAGGLAMLALVVAGLGGLIASHSWLRMLIIVAGGAYLCWLGASMVMGSFDLRISSQATPPRALPGGVTALFVFQFMNPKSWVMVLTAFSAVRASPESTNLLLVLAGLFVLVPVFCLSAWALLGARLTSWLNRPFFRAWFDRVLGVVLVASALLLVLAPFAAPHSR